MSRLTDCWQISQPLHLRHLAILRDQDIEKTIIFYRNFSQRNFAERVKAGEASWEAVELSASSQKKSNLKVPGVEATAELDQYGFPLTGPPKGLCRNGEASLYEALLACGPRDYKLTNHDPTVVRLANGKYSMCLPFL